MGWQGIGDVPESDEAMLVLHSVFPQARPASLF